jgi:hypothetical protein
MMEDLPKIMQIHGRIGLFIENPIERVHILNNRWNNVGKLEEMGASS